MGAVVLISYREYLLTPHWQDVRRRFFASRLVIRNSNNRPCCTGCKRSDVRLLLHHRTYKRLGKERLTDLVLVCDRCHEQIHAAPRYKSGLWGATRRVLRSIGRSNADRSAGHDEYGAMDGM
jgi:hypothetical protein